MEKLDKFLQQVRNADKKIVLATGVFDLLHQEHLRFLTKAKAVGDILVVGIETDQRVKEIKGQGRPIDSQEKRLKKLAGLSVVDQVFLLPTNFFQKDEHLSLLKKIKPNFLAVSSHTPFLTQKKELMEQIGGELKVVYEFQPHLSTTQLLSQQVSKK